MRNFIRHIAFYLLLFISVGQAAARPVYSPSARMVLERLAAAGRQGVRASQPACVPATICTGDVAVLQAAGISVGTRVGKWVTAQVPVGSFARLETLSGVEYVDAGRLAWASLDKALPDIGYDAVLEAADMPYPYQGEGVIVGVVDIGFQWDHIAFRNADGSTRILAAWNQNDSTGTPPDGYGYGSLFDTQDEIFSAHPCEVEIHATHVASIAAGSAFGDNPYGGVARRAELVLVDALHTPEGGIYTEGIIDGISFIFDYADKVGKPCVINLSIGGTDGPHDGTSPFDLMCDSLQGAGRLLVGAMGNNGNYNYHLGYDFTEGQRVLRSGLRRYTEVMPVADMWSDAPVRYAVEMCTSGDMAVVASTGWMDTGVAWRDTVLLYEGSEVLIEAASGQSAANGLYNTLLQLSANAPIPGDVRFVLAVEGGSGHIDLWSNAPSCDFHDFGNAALLAGDNNMSLLEVGGTGKRITSVGAYTTATAVTLQNGSRYTVDYTLHDVSPFSSRGYTRDGRLKPEVIAPGCIITAGFNEALAGNPSNYFSGTTVAAYDYGGKPHYYGVNVGTSMASPVVTGVYALWLQARPGLTPEEAKAVLQATSTHDNYTTQPAAAGYGKINPYAGLCYLLDVGSVGKVAESGMLQICPTAGDGNFTVVIPETGHAEVEVFTAAGRQVYRSRVACVAARPFTVAMPRAAPGVYLVRVSCNGMCKVAKYLLHK